MLGYCYIFHDIFHVKNVELPAVVVRRRRDLQGPLGVYKVLNGAVPNVRNNRTKQRKYWISNVGKATGKE